MSTRYILTMFAVLALALSCNEDEGPMKWVDLRYDIPEDEYLIDKEGEQVVTIRVKSTDPWEVYGKSGGSWYEISPDHGQAGDIFTVTITCQPNTSLDDRQDTIVVKSDYWTGKEFLLKQKGTAYLEYLAPDEIPIDGQTLTLEVLSNQNWKAEVTSGEQWLKIDGGSSGNGDDQVTLSAEANKGEQRAGEVTLYDRYGIPVHTIQVSQTGVMLSAALPENGKFYTAYSESQEIRIPVESNMPWTVVKNNPEEETWYEILGGNEYEGTAELVINLSEYTEGGGSAVREGILVLSTKPAEEGGFSLVKTIRIKQASPDANRTQIGEGKVLDSTGLTSEDGLPVGRYTFYLAPFTANDCIYLYFFWQKDGKSFAELRFWLNTSYAPMKTELSCMPYCNDVNKWQNHLLIPVDNTRQVKIAFDIMESAADASGNTWIYSEWLLNDQVIAKATSDGIADSNGVTDTWKVPFGDISAGGYFKIWAFSGSAILEKWEYTSPIVWGE